MQEPDIWFKKIGIVPTLLHPLYISPISPISQDTLLYLWNLNVPLEREIKSRCVDRFAPGEAKVEWNIKRIELKKGKKIIESIGETNCANDEWIKNISLLVTETRLYVEDWEFYKN